MATAQAGRPGAASRYHDRRTDQASLRPDSLNRSVRDLEAAYRAVLLERNAKLLRTFSDRRRRQTRFGATPGRRPNPADPLRHCSRRALFCLSWRQQVARIALFGGGIPPAFPLGQHRRVIGADEVSGLSESKITPDFPAKFIPTSCAENCQASAREDRGSAAEPNPNCGWTARRRLCPSRRVQRTAPFSRVHKRCTFL